MTPYCTVTHIQKRISQTAIDLRIDDDPTCVPSVIEEASIEIDGYCLLKYSETSLAASDWIRLKCTDIAVHYLCLRRLNGSPVAAQARYDKAIADLEKIQIGSLTIPDAPRRKASVPVLSAPRIRLDPFPRTVIEQSRSTGTAEGYRQHTDRTDVIDPNI